MTNNGTKLTWLGHATWLIETPGGKRVLVDPWTDGNPSCPDRFKGGGVDPLDLILATHGHGDHIGDMVTIAMRTGAPVVGIFELTSWLGMKGVEDLHGMNKGGTQEIAGLKVTLTHAVHSSTFVDDGTLVPLGEACGIVIEMENGFKVYDAGDTAVFGDMALIAELYAPDVCILPIGDYFTMGAKEAAKAVELLGATKVVPQHFGTFPVLTGTPADLQALVGPNVELLTVKPGGTIGWHADGAQTIGAH